MPLVLLRVDERLIHGQVIVGWGGPLRIERIVVADDDLAASEWEQELYKLGVPAEVRCDFFPIASSRSQLGSWQTAEERLAVLLRGVQELSRLSEGGVLAGQQVNLGGIHHAPGRQRVLPYLFLSADECVELEQVAATGADICARDLPRSARMALPELLARCKG